MLNLFRKGAVRKLMLSARIIKRRLLPFADDKFFAKRKPVCLHLLTLEANNKVDGVTGLADVQPVTRIEALRDHLVSPSLVCYACER
jgi:hypothetical protein